MKQIATLKGHFDSVVICQRCRLGGVLLWVDRLIWPTVNCCPGWPCISTHHY